MALQPQDIKGEIVLTVKFTAKPEHAERVAQLLRNLKAYADEKEPGCLDYQLVRHENVFALFERYKDLEAFGQHSKLPDLNELLTSGYAEDLQGVYYPGDKV